MWKNLTGLQKAKSLSQLNTSGVTYMQTLSQNSSPNTNDLYRHYKDKSVGTPPSLEQEKALTKLWQQRWKHDHVFKNCIPSLLQQFWKCLKWQYPYVQVIGVWWWVFGSRSAYKVTQRCSAGIRTWLSADQSSSSTLTESIIFFLNLDLYTESLSC